MISFPFNCYVQYYEVVVFKMLLANSPHHLPSVNPTGRGREIDSYFI